MTLFDFIEVFKKTWNETNKDKIRSKEQIKEIEELANTYKKLTEDIKNVYRLLNTNWKYLPIKQRKDYIKKTVNLISYGFDIEYRDDGGYTLNGGYANGLINIYESIYKTINNYHYDMKSYYHEKDYSFVNRLYENCINKVDQTLIEYNIKDSST